MNIDLEATTSINAVLADAWPGTELADEPTPLAGGFWASMYRLHVTGQPADIPRELVYRVAPSADMGAKELAVQRAVADLGFPTPRVRLSHVGDPSTGGTWSIMDFAPGSSPLGDLNGIAALRRGTGLIARLPKQLAAPMAALHALDPTTVNAAVQAAAPTVAWRVQDLLRHFEEAAHVLGRQDLATSVQQVAERRPAPGRLVVCHGDLHPFNLLIDDGGRTTVLDWTGAMLAEPAFDLAFTTLLLAHPPLAAPAPLAAIIGRIGAGLARRFITSYRALAPTSDLTALDWYGSVHGLRVLIELASIEARNPVDALRHPFASLRPAAELAVARQLSK